MEPPPPPPGNIPRATSLLQFFFFEDTKYTIVFSTLDLILRRMTVAEAAPPNMLQFHDDTLPTRIEYRMERIYEDTTFGNNEPSGYVDLPETSSASSNGTKTIGSLMTGFTLPPSVKQSTVLGQKLALVIKDDVKFLMPSLPKIMPHPGRVMKKYRLQKKKVDVGLLRNKGHYKCHVKGCTNVYTNANLRNHHQKAHIDKIRMERAAEARFARCEREWKRRQALKKAIEKAMQEEAEDNEYDSEVDSDVDDIENIEDDEEGKEEERRLPAELPRSDSDRGRRLLSS